MTETAPIVKTLMSEVRMEVREYGADAEYLLQGTVGDFCIECGHRWPCDTRRMADGVYADEDDNG